MHEPTNITKNTRGGTTYHFEFGGFQTAYKTALEESKRPNAHNVSAKPPAAWNGNVTTKQALDLAIRGWPEGRKKLDTALTDMRIDEMVASQVDVMYHDIEGPMLDVSAYLRGEPEMFMNFVEEPTEQLRKEAKLQMDVTYHSGTDERRIFNMGAIASALCYIFDTAGWATEITATSSVWSGSDNLICSYRVKDSHEGLNLDVMAFVCAHPASLRRVFFALMETIPEELREKFSISSKGNYSVPGAVILPGQDFMVEMSQATSSLEDAKQSAVKIANEIVAKKYRHAANYDEHNAQ